jgi:hypothetical protein
MTGSAQRSALRRTLASLKRKTIHAALRAMPDEASLQAQYFRAFRRFANLENPQRLTEKIQVIKLRGDLAQHSGWVDKIEAKRRVGAILGERWITPTLWSGRALPPVDARTWPTPYVIKANHGCGWCHHVVTDADKDWPAIEARCAGWLRRRWFPNLRERQYDAIEPQLLIEPRLGGGAAVLPADYKFHVFNGRVAFCGVTIERLQGPKITAMDRNWQRLPFTMDRFPAAPETPVQPVHLKEMIDAAETLAAPFHYARIDFYSLPEGPRFGEITLTSASGLRPFDPDIWDFHFGALLDLNAPVHSAAIMSPVASALSRA